MEKRIGQTNAVLASRAGYGRVGVGSRRGPDRGGTGVAAGSGRLGAVWRAAGRRWRRTGGEREALTGDGGAADGPDDIRRAAEDAQGCGPLVRSLVTMDRAAAKKAQVPFTNAKTLIANPLEFVNLIVDHLPEHGVVQAARLYESPFTELTPRAPDGPFEANEPHELMRALDSVRTAAMAA
ncbi:MAG: hypothetical protein JXR37_01790 [Kiritimatiellae bacterium]|nr:hypothetical protein [Kiritimatiellia bacterium]